LKKLNKIRLKGGALYYAIFVMLILSMISILLVSFFRLSFKEDVLFLKTAQLNTNLQSASTFISCNPELIAGKKNIELDLFEDGEDIVFVENVKWGMLTCLKFSASWRNIKLQKASLFAEKEKERCVLWMPDNKKYVSLAGKSYINGLCYLSALGLRKGNVDGRYFEGPYLYKGSIKESTAQMPIVSKQSMDGILTYLNGNANIGDSISDIGKTDILNRSFWNSTVVLKSEKRLILKKGTYKDNIVIFSPDTIEVWPSVNLSDVILVGKTIIFMEGVESTLQAFASSSIIVNSGCKLNYPSFLGVISQKPEAHVSIGENAEITGGIFSYSTRPEEIKTMLKIGKGAVVYGKVYVNGDADFNGSVNGSLYCNRFIHSTPRAFYENFILDAVIDEDKLPNDFASYRLDNEELFKLKEVRLCN